MLLIIRVYNYLLSLGKKQLYIYLGDIILFSLQIMLGTNTS